MIKIYEVYEDWKYEQFTNGYFLTLKGANKEIRKFITKCNGDKDCENSLTRRIKIREHILLDSNKYNIKKDD